MSDNSSDSSLHLLLFRCSDFTPSISTLTAFTVANLLLLPLYILVLYVGFQSSAHTTTHSDVFTYNVVALEMISILGCCIYCAGAFLDDVSVIRAGTDVFFISSPGQTLFQILTCVERYLAIVWPVIYLGLRQAAGLRIRNISIGCVWLICFVSLCAGKTFTRFYSSVAVSCFLVFSLIVVSFCSLSVLCALIGPGPGDMGGDRARVDRTKRRAADVQICGDAGCQHDARFGAEPNNVFGGVVDDVVDAAQQSDAAAAVPAQSRESTRLQSQHNV